MWASSLDNEVRVYRLNTVTYGTSSAPYLAMRCLKQLALENQHLFPLACAHILNDFYMDDLLCGHNSLLEAVELQTQIFQILKQGQFNLYKWSSKDPALIPLTSNQNQNTIEFNNSEDKKTRLSVKSVY